MRIEFQHRGSPHVHSLLWIQNSPKYQIASVDEIVKFIDNTITCKLPSSESVLNESDIQLQQHKHTHTCYKKKGIRHCRFGIPYPPMSSTRILEPYELNDQTATVEEKKQNTLHKQVAKKYISLLMKSIRKIT